MKLSGKALALCGCLVLLSACASRSRSFAVIPGNPYYSLQSPDRTRTPFPDILRAWNGYFPGKESVELRPSMQLQIENAYYQPGSSRRGLDGFLGTEKAQYDVVANGLKLRSVEPMPNRPSADKPVQELIPASQTHFEHYAFYFEVLFSRRKDIRGSALLGAHTIDELDSLMAKMSDPDTVCGAGSGHCAVFPEACSVAIYMRVMVNGQPRQVLWGSKLSAIAEGATQVSLKRLYQGKELPVHLDASDPTAFTIPLLPGDQIHFAPATK